MKKYLALIGLGAAIIIILLGVYWWVSRQPQYRFGTDRAAVIRQIQSLSRMETASFSVDKVIEASTNYGKLRQLLFGDKVLLIARGKVIAGFDLTKMQPQDFKGLGSSVTLTLPAPEILSTNIDNSQTRVFDRDQGIFTKGELNLEAEARQQAESAIRQAACEGGILDEATRNGKQQIETIFKAAGFSSVTVTVPAGNCGGI